MKHMGCLKVITHIHCPDCGKIKRGTRWGKMTEAEKEKLDKRIKDGCDYKVILESCGCLFKEVENGKRRSM